MKVLPERMMLVMWRCATCDRIMAAENWITPINQRPHAHTAIAT